MQAKSFCLRLSWEKREIIKEWISSGMTEDRIIMSILKSGEKEQGTVHCSYLTSLKPFIYKAFRPPSGVPF